MELEEVTGILQQIIPGKVPEGDLAVCHIPGTCIINHQNPLIGIIPLRNPLIYHLLQRYHNPSL